MKGHRLGDRRRFGFDRAELHAALATLTKATSTVRHYRGALFHLYTTLDGKNEPNPLRDVAPPPVPELEPRSLPYELIESIVDAMPDRGQGVRNEKRSEVSKTKLRLRVLAYTGLPHAQIARLKPQHVDWDSASVLVHGRKKGKGSRTARLPLTEPALAALRAFFDAKATGPFSRSSFYKSWWRAIHTVVDNLALHDFRAAKQLLDELTAMGARPYDVRHSFLTASYLAGKDLRATQALAMHTNSRMTERYTLAAVDPRLRDVASQLNARFVKQPL